MPHEERVQVEHGDQNADSRVNQYRQSALPKRTRRQDNLSPTTSAIPGDDILTKLVNDSRVDADLMKKIQHLLGKKAVEKSHAGVS